MSFSLCWLVPRESVDTSTKRNVGKRNWTNERRKKIKGCNDIHGPPSHWGVTSLEHLSCLCILLHLFCSSRVTPKIFARMPKAAASFYLPPIFHLLLVIPRNNPFVIFGFPPPFSLLLTREADEDLYSLRVSQSLSQLLTHSTYKNKEKKGGEIIIRKRDGRFPDSRFFSFLFSVNESFPAASTQ